MSGVGCSLTSWVTHLAGVHRGDFIVFQDSRQRPAKATSTSGSSVSGATPLNAEAAVCTSTGPVFTRPTSSAVTPPPAVNIRATVAAGELWAAGDHRSQSADRLLRQQEPAKGLVPVKDVLGQAVVIIWSVNQVGSWANQPRSTSGWPPPGAEQQRTGRQHQLLNPRAWPIPPHRPPAADSPRHRTSPGRPELRRCAPRRLVAAGRAGSESPRNGERAPAGRHCRA